MSFSHGVVVSTVKVVVLSGSAESLPSSALTVTSSVPPSSVLKIAEYSTLPSKSVSVVYNVNGSSQVGVASQTVAVTVPAWLSASV